MAIDSHMHINSIVLKDEQESLLKTIYNKQKDVIFLLADMWRDTILLMKETIFLM